MGPRIAKLLRERSAESDDPSDVADLVQQALQALPPAVDEGAVVAGDGESLGAESGGEDHTVRYEASSEEENPVDEAPSDEEFNPVLDGAFGDEQANPVVDQAAGDEEFNPAVDEASPKPVVDEATTDREFDTVVAEAPSDEQVKLDDLARQLRLAELKLEALRLRLGHWTSMVA